MTEGLLMTAKVKEVKEAVEFSNQNGIIEWGLPVRLDENSIHSNMVFYIREKGQDDSDRPYTEWNTPILGVKYKRNPLNRPKNWSDGDTKSKCFLVLGKFIQERHYFEEFSYLRPNQRGKTPSLIASRIPLRVILSP